VPIRGLDLAQESLDLLLVGRPVRVEERYAALLRTVGLAALAAPMLPLSPLIGLTGESPFLSALRLAGACFVTGSYVHCSIALRTEERRC
jgi:hypothetical protein